MTSAMSWGRLARVILLAGLGLGADQGVPVHGQTLDLPARSLDALAGSSIMDAVRDLELQEREDRIVREVLAGNVPEWLRDFAEIEIVRGTRRVRFSVLPDYLMIGSDADHVRIPLSPQAAQRIADGTQTSLPTVPMVDAIWRAATVQLTPDPIPPSAAMTTVEVFEDHDRAVRSARRDRAGPTGSLVAGHKKDVVLSARLDTLAGRVAIYGWHEPDGVPIQPLYTGHLDSWVDYSHGIRLVHRAVWIDDVQHDLRDVLTDPDLAALLNDDGTLVRSGYSARGGEPPRGSPGVSPPA